MSTKPLEKMSNKDIELKIKAMKEQIRVYHGNANSVSSKATAQEYKMPPVSQFGEDASYAMPNDALSVLPSQYPNQRDDERSSTPESLIHETEPNSVRKEDQTYGHSQIEEGSLVDKYGSVITRTDFKGSAVQAPSEIHPSPTRQLAQSSVTTS